MSEERYVLRTKPAGRDLDRYEFANRLHALKWVSQQFVTDEKFEIEIYQMIGDQDRPCPRCGHREKGKPMLMKTMGITRFLAVYLDKEGY